MRSAPFRSSTGLFTAALGLVLVLVIAGLYSADRSVVRMRQSRAALDAFESAALTQGSLAMHAEALDAFRGLYLVPLRDTSRLRFDEFVSELAAHHPGFRRVWVADTSGRIVEQAIFSGTRHVLPPRADIDTLELLGLRGLADRARRSRRTELSSPRRLTTGERGVVMLEPLYLGARFVGFAGGTIVARAVLQQVTQSHAEGRSGIVLLAGSDTLAAIAPPAHRRLEYASAPVRLPDGSSGWRVVIAHEVSGPALRIALWVLGLLALATLTVGVVRERRQAARVADRSMELERLSAELLRANRAKSEFLANVSHELRTPLNAIVGFVDLLRDGVYGELTPRQATPVDRIAASAAHLRQLVDQVLDLAKMAAGRLEVHTESIDLRPFVLEVMSETEPLAAERGLGLSIAVGASLPRVRTDPTHLRQILVNLVGNAVKYTTQGGISVRARLVGGPVTETRGRRITPAEGLALRQRAPDRSKLWIALQVSDTGLGIAPEDQERIFEEFEQVNAGPRGDSVRRGTGLGLAISRRLARLLGGEITVESELGKGSTFTLWIPVNPVDLRPDTSGVRPALTGTGGR